MWERIVCWFKQEKLTKAEAAVFGHVATAAVMGPIRGTLFSQLANIFECKRQLTSDGYTLRILYRFECALLPRCDEFTLAKLTAKLRGREMSVNIVAADGVVSRMQFVSSQSVQPYSGQLTNLELTFWSDIEIADTNCLLSGWVKEYFDEGWISGKAPPADWATCSLESDEAAMLPAEYREFLLQTDGGLLNDNSDTTVLGIRDRQKLQLGGRTMVPLIDQREAGAIAVALDDGVLLHVGGAAGDGYPIGMGFKEVVKAIATGSY